MAACVETGDGGLDGGAGMTVVHYLNQFFAGLGGEEAAGHEPVRLDGPQGPGRGAGRRRGSPRRDARLRRRPFRRARGRGPRTLLAWIDELEPDVLVCGPSFGSGRYGYACGVLAREAGRRGIPVVAAMTPDSPGVLAAEGAAYIVPTASNVAGMRAVVPVMAGLAARLAAGEPVLGGPEEEGYLPRGLCASNTTRRPARAPRVRSAWCWRNSPAMCAPRSTHRRPGGARHRRRADVVDCPTLALVTEAGCVPQGNPDRLPDPACERVAPVSDRRRRLARRRGTYGARGVRHHGEANARPEPARAAGRRARARRAEGRFGRVHDEFFTTSGVDTPVATAAKFGQEIAAEIREAGVDAVILTGT